MGNAHCPGSIRRGCFPVVCAGAAGLRCPVGRVLRCAGIEKHGPCGAAVRLSAIHGVHRHDAGTVRGEQLRRRDAGGLFRGHAYREHLHRAHGGGGQRDVLLHRAEHRRGGVQPCAQGIPGVLWHSGCVRAGDLRGASVLFAAAHCAVPQRGKLTPRAGDRNVLHSFPGVVLYPHRPENGHGRRAARRAGAWAWCSRVTIC